VLEHLGPLRVVRRDGAHERLLAEEEAHRVLDVGVHELVVGDAVAERVDAGQPPGPQRLEQGPPDAGQRAALVAQAVLVRAPVDDVHRRAAGEQLRPVVVEVAQLDERDAEALGQVRVLPVGAVARPSVRTMGRSPHACSARPRSASAGPRLPRHGGDPLGDPPAGRPRGT
jgi:hypothetical protein